MNRTCPQCGRNQVRLQYLGYGRFATVPCFYCHTHLAIDFRARVVLWSIIVGSMFLGAIVTDAAQRWYILPAFLVVGLTIGALVVSTIGKLEVASKYPHSGVEK